MNESTQFLIVCLALIVFFAGLLWAQIRSVRIEKSKGNIIVKRMSHCKN